MRYFVVISSVIMFFLTNNFANGRTLIESTLEQCYFEQEYDYLINIGNSILKNDQSTAYDLTYVLLFQSRAYYKKSDFKNCWKKIQDSYISAENLDYNIDENARLAVDVALTLGGYSFLAFEYNAGLNAAEKANNIIENYLKYDPELKIKMYLRKIVLSRGSQQFVEAFEFVDQAKCFLPHMETEKARDFEITILAEEAQLRNDNNELIEAVEIYQKLLNIASELKDTNRLTVYNNNIGIAYFKMKDFGKSESCLRKSLEFKRNKYSKFSPTLISNYSNLALVNIWMEKYEDADEYYLTLIKIISETYGEFHPRNALTYSNLGTSLYFQKKYHEAISYFEKSLQIRIAKDESVDGTSLDNLMMAKCHYELGNFDKAKSNLLETLKIPTDQLTNYDDSQLEINVLLAQIYKIECNNHLYSEAMERAISNIKYETSRPFQFENLEVPTNLFQILKLEIAQQLDIFSSDSSKENEELINHKLAVADSLYQFIKYRFDDYETRRKLFSQLKWIHEARLDYQYLLQSHFGNADYQEILTSFERSKNIFLSERISESNSTTAKEIPQDLIFEKNRFRDSITFYNRKISELSNGDLTENYSNFLPNLNKAKDSLSHTLAKIKQNYPKYYSNIYKPENQNIHDIQNELSENGFDLNYFYGDDIYILLIGKKDVHFSKINDSHAVNTKIQDFLIALQSKESGNCIQELGYKLYQQIIPKKIQNNYCELNIIPDGNFATLPFEVLTDKNGSFLFETMMISYKYSQKKSLNQIPLVENVLAMAPIFENDEKTIMTSFAQREITRNNPGHLPQSELEVKNVARLFNTKPYLHAEATEENFKSLASEMDIIHLATHGVIDNKNPNNTRLYFNKNNFSSEDGFLYSNEIAGMNLKADLVTLSACNTGTGKQHLGEGIESLGRAFAHAGCMNQMISLWPVNDNSTQQIMSHYYKNLKNGYGKAEALQVAKKQYLNESPSVLKHPYYWAGLVYYGDDSPLNFQDDKSKYIWLLTFSLLILSILFYYFRK